MNFGIVGIFGQFGFGDIDPFADICQCLVDFNIGIEFKRHRCPVLIGLGTHFLDTFDRTQFLLHRAQQQPFGIFGRNTVMMHGDIKNRDLDVRIGFFRDGVIANPARRQQQDQNKDDGSRPV